MLMFASSFAGIVSYIAGWLMVAAAFVALMAIAYVVVKRGVPGKEGEIKPPTRKGLMRVVAASLVVALLPFVVNLIASLVMAFVV